MNNKKLSEQLSDFLNMISAAERSLTYMQDKLAETDKATQDLLHSLELDSLNYRERAKLATKLAEIRRQRRGYKDGAEELAPVAAYAANNKQAIKNLQALLGEVRKLEKYRQSRRYFPRIIHDAADKSGCD